MADRNKNHINFDIPKSIIFLAFLFCWPVGIVLAVLRSVSIPVNRKNEQTTYNTYNSHSEHTAYHTSNNEIRTDTKRQEAKAEKNAAKSTKSKAVKVTQTISLITFIVGLFISSFWALNAADTGIIEGLIGFIKTALPVFFASGVSFAASKHFSTRDRRLRRIRAIIGNRESINLTKLSTASRESLKSVRSDVQHMIDNGEFGDSAYIDLGTNNFMRSTYAKPDDPEVFDYRSVYGDVFKKDENKASASENTTEEKPSDDNTEKNENVDFGKIISEIRRLNDEIANLQVSNRIYSIETHTKNIFDYVTEHPEAKPKIRTFMNYYLPTTLKLLESYSKIEHMGVAGDNMKQSKEQIENILDLLVVGFEQQVDQLFKNESIDISSDIRVLEQMMQKDGLGGKSDFGISKNNDDILNCYTDEISDDITTAAGGAAAAEYGKR